MPKSDPTFCDQCGKTKRRDAFFKRGMLKPVKNKPTSCKECFSEFCRSVRLSWRDQDGQPLANDPEE